MKNPYIKIAFGSALAALALARCGSGLTGDPNSTVWVQVERLARPAINEGLVITNDYLNAYNSIAPSVDLTDAASAVVAEAAAVLTAVKTFGGGGAPTVANVAGGFIPDVMRIDTTLSLSPGVPGASTTAYNQFVNDNVTKPIILVGGRKLNDDVINITLGYLFATNPSDTLTTEGYNDHVTYYGGVANCGAAGTGANNGNPGHKCLDSQGTLYGAAQFPFLAAAN